MDKINELRIYTRTRVLGACGLCLHISARGWLFRFLSRGDGVSTLYQSVVFRRIQTSVAYVAARYCHVGCVCTAASLTYPAFHSVCSYINVPPPSPLPAFRTPHLTRGARLTRMAHANRTSDQARWAGWVSSHEGNQCPSSISGMVLCATEAFLQWKRTTSE